MSIVLAFLNVPAQRVAITGWTRFQSQSVYDRAREREQRSHFDTRYPHAAKLPGHQLKTVALQSLGMSYTRTHMTVYPCRLLTNSGPLLDLIVDIQTT
jgi:hypothetical protein